jgi:pimeloyl-ACP methyl ester carboxylesterase
MTEKMVASGDAELCTEAFGEPSDTAILMVMGAMASMLWWPRSLCVRLARAGRFVIRYDNRDTGRSTSYEPGRATYTFEDMADDAIAVLDGYGVETAHLVGMSMGGGIVQLAALKHPDRVAGVTAISATKLDRPDPDLPGPDPEYLEHAAAFERLDWTDTQALAELVVRDARQLAGSRHRFDEVAAREFVERDLARAVNPPSLANHGMLGGGEEWQGRLGEIDVPFLVIHGTADPLIPHPHGVALARAVPGARLVTVDGGGHELHERDEDQIAAAIVEQTATESAGEAPEPGLTV